MNLEETCWTMIRHAASGKGRDRRVFAEHYLPVVRAYLAARWRTDSLLGELDDAVQEVFLDLFREDGALARVQEGRPGGFRAYLYGVSRNIGRRCESRRARSHERSGREVPPELPSAEPSLQEVFDRAWSLSILDQAVQRHRERAAAKGEVGERRVDLLRLRFWEDLPIRTIAARWGWEPKKVQKEYARAREDFRRALVEIVAFHHPFEPEAVRSECERLLASLP